MIYTTPTVAEYMAENVPEHLHCAFEREVLYKVNPMYTGKHATPHLQMFIQDLDDILKKVKQDMEEIINCEVGC